MNKNQIIKDLPIYVNGFVVTYLFMATLKQSKRLLTN